MTDHSFIDADHAAVASAARMLYSRYRNYVEYEDVQQVLYLWLLEKYDRVVRWRAEHDEERAYRTQVKALRNAGERYCRTEKAERDGYAPEDEFFYSLKMVADLLELAFDPEWMLPRGIDYTDESPPVNVGSDLMTMVADVGRAYNTLPKTDQDLLRYCYGGDRTHSEAIANLSIKWKCSSSAAYNRVRRVVGRVRAALGGPNPWRDIT